MRFLALFSLVMLAGCHSVVTVNILSVNRQAIAPDITPAVQCAALLATNVRAGSVGVTLDQQMQVCEAIIAAQKPPKEKP
jgi:hypothetical protein